MGVASARRIYDIPAHSITEIHGVELHDPDSMLNKVFRAFFWALAALTRACR